MDDGTIFYIAGGLLTASAVIVSFIGLKVKGFPGRLGPIVVLWFIALIGVTSTYAVLHSKHEEEPHHDEAGVPAASKEAEEIESE